MCFVTVMVFTTNGSMSKECCQLMWLHHQHLLRCKLSICTNVNPFKCSDSAVSVRSDVISIEKTGEHFRLIYDVKGRFTVHRITAEEAKVRSVTSKKCL